MVKYFILSMMVGFFNLVSVNSVLAEETFKDCNRRVAQEFKKCSEENPQNLKSCIENAKENKKECADLPRK